jgi:hypothetical protein
MAWYLVKHRNNFTCILPFMVLMSCHFQRHRSCLLRIFFSVFAQWTTMYEGVSKSFRTGRPERELQMVQLSATRCSCIAVLWVSLASFAAITLCVVSQRVFIIVVVVYFVIDSVRKLSDTPSYLHFFYNKCNSFFFLSFGLFSFL